MVLSTDEIIRYLIDILGNIFIEDSTNKLIQLTGYKNGFLLDFTPKMIFICTGMCVGVMKGI